MLVGKTLVFFCDSLIGTSPHNCTGCTICIALVNRLIVPRTPMGLESLHRTVWNLQLKKNKNEKS